MKNVNFNLHKNQTYFVYSREEYDRFPIDSILYLKSYRRVSYSEWKLVLKKLNYYKLTDMIVHNKSINSIKLTEIT